ncbi:MAG: paraquat-inducible protein A, partial [Pseudomonadota bacterium]
ASALAKWSMLDVLLVALAIFAAKTSGLANAITQPGLWFFALSAITVALATAGIKR